MWTCYVKSSTPSPDSILVRLSGTIVKKRRHSHEKQQSSDKRRRIEPLPNPTSLNSISSKPDITGCADLNILTRCCASRLLQFDQQTNPEAEMDRDEIMRAMPRK